MFYAARSRARKKGVPFSITPDDIVIPETCPVFGTPIQLGCGRHHANGPALDRLIPELGYVPGNVEVISFRANFIKTNACLEELEALQVWLKSRLASRKDISNVAR